MNSNAKTENASMRLISVMVMMIVLMVQMRKNAVCSSDFFF